MVMMVVLDWDVLFHDLLQIEAPDVQELLGVDLRLLAEDHIHRIVQLTSPEKD